MNILRKPLWLFLSFLTAFLITVHLFLLTVTYLFFMSGTNWITLSGFYLLVLVSMKLIKTIRIAWICCSFGLLAISFSPFFFINDLPQDVWKTFSFFQFYLPMIGLCFLITLVFILQIKYLHYIKSKMFDNKEKGSDGGFWQILSNNKIGQVYILLGYFPVLVPFAFFALEGLFAHYTIVVMVIFFHILMPWRIYVNHQYRLIYILTSVVTTLALIYVFLGNAFF